MEQRHFDTAVRGEVTWSEQRRRRLREFLPYVGLPSPEDRLDELFASYNEHYIANWRAFDDAARTLRRVRDAGLTVGVLTNGDLDNQQAKLDAAGLSGLAGPVFASAQLGFGKPDPRAYAAALARLGAKAATTMMVGDNYALDVLAARDCGLRAVHLDRLDSAAPPDDERIGTLDDLALV